MSFVKMIKKVGGKVTAIMRDGTSIPLNAAGRVATFADPGTFNWIVPDNVHSAYVVVIGGGGSGHRPGDPTGGIGGGGGGGVAEKHVTGLVPGESIEIKVGAGGNGLSSGQDGDNSYFRSNTYLNATGGQDGEGTSGGSPGTGTGGDLNYSLGFGSDPTGGGHGAGPGGGRGSSASGASATGTDGTTPGSGASGTRYDGRQGGHGLVQIFY